MGTCLVTFTEATLMLLGWYSFCRQAELEVRELVLDSRLVKKKYAFLALDGLHFKGKDYVFDALSKGAAAVFIDAIYEAEITHNPQFQPELPIFFSTHFKDSLGQTVSYFYGEPSRQMHVIGITGTNGKTTIAFAFYHILEALKHKAAYLGTLGVYIRQQKLASELTTLDLITNHRLLAQALKKRVLYAILEASSHGLHQGRLEGIFWNLAIFTNLTPEHLDYHKTMENYFLAKRILFEQLLLVSQKAAGAVFGAIIGTDSPWGEKLALWLKEKKPSFPVITLGQKADASLVSIQPAWSGYSASLLFAQKTYQLKTRFLGTFNLVNLASVFLGLRLMGFDADVILEQISQLVPPPGRMEVIAAPEGRHIVIDYAHTPDALEKVLRTLAELNPVRIIVVFGCGGERDQEKRPLMGKIASQLADFVILTNDNPRGEDPSHIIQDIKKGMSHHYFVVVPDREKAIRTGLQILGIHEVLLIAGKGHEEYQVIQDKKIRFSDREVTERLLKEIHWTS